MNHSKEKKRWKPHVTVAAIIEQDQRFLMVEENTVDGVRLNQPAGHLEANESLLQAVIRETREETGYSFRPDCLVGFYRWCNQSNGMTFLRCVFAGSECEPIPQAELDQGVIRAVWMSREELLTCPDKHRSPLVMRCITDWTAGSRYNLSLLKDLG